MNVRRKITDCGILVKDLVGLLWLLAGTVLCLHGECMLYRCMLALVVDRRIMSLPATFAAQLQL